MLASAAPFAGWGEFKGGKYGSIGNLKVVGAAVQLQALLPSDKILQPSVVAAAADEEDDNGTRVRLRIARSQFLCFQRITGGSDRKIHSNGTAINHCNATWDGWLCWEDTEPGATEQNCPDYYHDFDTRARAIKVCTVTGEWARHPDSNRTWTDYTACKPDEDNWTVRDALALAEHHPSAATKSPSVGSRPEPWARDDVCLNSPFFFPQNFELREDNSSQKSFPFICLKLRRHRDLVLRDAWGFAERPGRTDFPNVRSVCRARHADPLSASLSEKGSCKILAFVHMYIMSCNYFWMLCEGIYLHTLIVVAVFAEKQHLVWYYLLGWG
ncbi:hypothetical protein CCH79_00013384 [Gambusia affinis]|uniref:G-protein coupled receptors family 2 profile 1 domain-containing protein n=1 Tax=Gambusia affinis TaxID=33528 RepID=A0A315W836_GAMAF|nr:hypothetical protein CCH79_00013384 [Gambusia affinis]